MGLPLALLAAAVSLAALLAGGPLEPALRGSSRLALAALPWLALAGLPASRPGAAAPRRWPFELALALPALALGAWLDLRAGLAPAAAAWTAGGAVGLMALLGEAGRRAPLRPAIYAGAWALAVAAGPLLLASVGPRPTASALARLSPLAWLWERVELGSAPGPPASLAGPALAALALVGLGLLPERGGPR